MKLPVYLLLSLALAHASPLLPTNSTLNPSVDSIVTTVAPKVQATSDGGGSVSDAITAINNAVNTAASQITSAVSSPIGSDVPSIIQTQTQQIVPPLTPTLPLSAPSVERTTTTTSESTKQIIPASISSIPSSLASQAQSQMSGIQSQVSSMGGSAINQIQSQMASAQSQVASIPATLGGMIPSWPFGSTKNATNTSTSALNYSLEQSTLLSEPINQTTKLAMDVNEQIQKYLPTEETATTILPSIYSARDVGEPKDEKQQPQIAMLIDQVNRLADTIEGTISDLIDRGRNVTATMLRAPLNYVRRVRNNLERLQTRLQFAGQNSTQTSATATVSTSNIPGSSFFNSIRDRINGMTEEISALVTRIRGSLLPGATGVELTSTIAPITVLSPMNIGQAAASGTILSTINSISQQNPPRPSI